MFIINRLLQPEINRQVREAMAHRETDATFAQGSRNSQQGDRDRFTYDRQEVMEQALEAWRVNPLARRIVELTSQYVMGGGLSFECTNDTAHKFIDKFFEHRLNRMSIRLTEWCDELSRTGNLFILLSTDPTGMSYVRAIPATQVKEIKSADNDIEQSISFTILVQNTQQLTPTEVTYTAYSQNDDAQRLDGTYPVVMLHYAINRPCGAQWGESDLAPILRWLSRYANWLEDRARLNRYRTSFLYNVQSKFASEAERLARQQQLNSTPPSPGSILVTDENETWSVIEPKLASSDAAEDGLSLKKMIAAGTGIPLHFLAEPESATRTTAEAAGGPTFRRFEQRQRYFMWLINDIISIAVRRRSMVDRHMPVAPDFEVTGADISARDNVSLAMATSNIVNSLAVLRDRRMIDDSEFLRLTYRFAGETAEIDELLAAGRLAGKPLGIPAPPAGTTANQPNVNQATPTHPQPNIKVKNPKLIDPKTGEETNPVTLANSTSFVGADLKTLEDLAILESQKEGLEPQRETLQQAPPLRSTSTTAQGEAPPPKGRPDKEPLTYHREALEDLTPQRPPKKAKTFKYRGQP